MLTQEDHLLEKISLKEYVDEFMFMEKLVKGNKQSLILRFLFTS
jgi:hypothetical protein